MWKRGGGTDRNHLAILHNGAALYASNAGKLNGLAPEAYIQPQDNILDNGHLAVNQQAKKLYDKPGLTVDRWKILGEYTKVEVVDDGIKITTTQPTLLNIFIQILEIEKDLIGEDLAATVELGDSSNGVEACVHAYSSDNSYLSGSYKFVNSNSAETFHFIVPENTKRLQFIFRPAVYGQESFFVIKRAKLEKGRRFTGWPVWNYAQELAKCQRYFYRFCTHNETLKIDEIEWANGSKFFANFTAIVPNTMRIKPVAAYHNVKIAIKSSNTILDLPDDLVFTIFDGSSTYIHCNIGVPKDAFNIDISKDWYLIIAKNGYIEFNANL